MNETFADPLDHAEHIQSQAVARSIKEIRNKGRELLPIGACHWCKDEPKACCR